MAKTLPPGARLVVEADEETGEPRRVYLGRGRALPRPAGVFGEAFAHPPRQGAEFHRLQKRQQRAVSGFAEAETLQMVRGRHVIAQRDELF
jgi:hypothetical protein